MKKYMFTETQIKNVVDDALLKQPIKKYIFTETQIKNVVDKTFFNLIQEQDDDDEHELDFLDDPGGPGGEERLDGDGEGENDPVMMPGFDPEDGEQEQGFLNPPEAADFPKQKKLNDAQQKALVVKTKWLREQPGLTDLQMDEHMVFFKERKERLKPYIPYDQNNPTIDPQTKRVYINVPEVTAQVEKFPDMIDILSNAQKMKDIQNYTWEQISFYMDRILNLNRVVDDETYIQGDETLEEKFKRAYERWIVPRGQIVNEGNITVYRIESKNESVALGALQICIHEKYSLGAGFNYNAWCTARPEHSRYGSNMYNTYRSDYGAAFYYVLDKNRKEDDIYYISAINVKGAGHGNRLRPYTLISRKNGDDSNYSWDEIVQKYPALNGKEGLFTYFGTTRKEQTNFTLDKITFRRGDPYDFATLSPQLQNQYIDSKRHISEVRSFMSMEATERKLYIDKTVKTEDDYKYRFRCGDRDNPFGILNALNDAKPQDYKYLDYVLKEKLGIPMGITAIRLSIVGGEWKLLLTDGRNSVTLCTMKTGGKLLKSKEKDRFGLLSMTDGGIIKPVDYFKGTLRSVMMITRNEGLTHRNMLHLQRYNKSITGIPTENPDDYFYFFSAWDAYTVKSNNYLKGTFFEGPAGDAFIREKTATKEIIILP